MLSIDLMSEIISINRPVTPTQIIIFSVVSFYALETELTMQNYFIV